MAATMSDLMAHLEQMVELQITEHALDAAQRAFNTFFEGSMPDREDLPPGLWRDVLVSGV